MKNTAKLRVITHKNAFYKTKLLVVAGLLFSSASNNTLANKTLDSTWADL